jgi:hypothetical protein
MLVFLVACIRAACPSGQVFDQDGLCVVPPPDTGTSPTDSGHADSTPDDTSVGDSGDSTPTDGLPVGAPCDPSAPACVAGASCCTACCAFDAAPVCTEGDTCPLPDLSVDAGNAASWLTVTTESFAEDSCAVQEGCVVPGERRLLRFTVTTPNSGTGPLTLGDPSMDPRFQWSGCHGHYHFRDYLEASVLDVSGLRVTGQKQAFCLMDSEPWDSPDGPAVYFCGNQGISVGWADTYVAGLDCQWVDVTGLPPGDYTLRLTVDPEDLFPETDETNDSVEVPFTL